MEFVKLTPDKYGEWDAFCEASDDTWFWHSSSWLEYSLKYNPKLKAKSKSFMVYNNHELIAICSLILQTNDQGVKEFCYNNEHGPMPAFSNKLSKKTKEKAVKAVYSHIDGIAQENNVARIMFRFTVLSKAFIEAPKQVFNYLMKFGYLDNSINTQVIDLNKPIEILKNNLRNDHKNNINKISKKISTEIFDKSKITDSIFNEYVEMHHKAAGRVTRPRSTFDLMHDLIKDGNAFLVAAKMNNVFIGFSYFFVYKNNVYYGSSCNDPEENRIPVSHAVQWAAIEYMAEKKYKFYELGWQQFGLQLYDMPSEKQINISEFKRGFGGFTVPWLRGEKFYDKNYFLEIQEDRIKKYFEQL
jgi:lipid II:glycine glycyltransferase (peptidoglycan interpeptide bridge formation enzyme)